MMALENKLVAYFKENVDELHDLVREINSYDGSFEELTFYPNDEEFFEVFFNGVNPIEVARSVAYGDYNYTDEYVNFNAYGNLISMDGCELDELLLKNIKDIVAEYIDNYIDNNYIFVSSEVQEMVDEYEG